MCVAALAAIGPAVSMIGTIGGLASSAIGIMQGQQQMQQQQQAAQMQAMQAQQNMDLQYQQAQQQSFQQRREQVQKHISDTRAQQANHLSYYNQLNNNNEAANKVYTQEQVKLNEAKTAAAFKAQSNYIKSIGARGKILASGASGQSVGLLALDVERQEGFKQAETNASIRSAEQQAAIGMDMGYTQAKSANNKAYSGLLPIAQAPQFAADPNGIGKDLNLGIPTYDWN